MLKLEIKLDEKQIITDAKYSCEKVYGAIDKAFSTYQFRKEIYEDGQFVIMEMANQEILVDLV